jgi:hypothetical protein
MHVYEIRPRKDKRGVNLISDALPFGRLWYGEVPHAIGYAIHYSRSHDAMIRVYGGESSKPADPHRRTSVSLSPLLRVLGRRLLQLRSP